MKILFSFCSLLFFSFLCITTNFMLGMEKEKVKPKTAPPLRAQCINYCTKNIAHYLPQLLSTQIPSDISCEVLNSLTKEELEKHKNTVWQIINSPDASLEVACYLVLTKYPHFNVPTLKLYERINTLIQNKDHIPHSALELLAHAFKPQDICDRSFFELIPQALANHPQAQLFIQKLFQVHHENSAFSFSLKPSSMSPCQSIVGKSEKKEVYKAVVKNRMTTGRVLLPTRHKIYNTAGVCVAMLEDDSIATNGETQFLATVSPDGKFAALVTPLKGIRIYRVHDSQHILTLHFEELHRYIPLITHIAFDKDLTHFHFTISNSKQAKYIEYLLPQAYFKQELTLEQLIYLMILHYYLHGNKSHSIPFFEKIKRVAAGRALIAAHKLKKTEILESFKDGDYSLASDELARLTQAGKASQKSMLNHSFISQISEQQLETAYKNSNEFIFALKSYFMTDNLESLPADLAAIPSLRLQKKISKALLKTIKEIDSEKDLSTYKLVYSQKDHKDKITEYTREIVTAFLSLRSKISQAQLQETLCSLARTCLDQYLMYQ